MAEGQRQHSYVGAVGKNLDRCSDDPTRRDISADLLFSDGDLRLTLESIRQKMIDEISAAPEEHLIQVDEDEWVSALVERWSVEAPELHPEKMWMDRPQEVQVDVRGYPNRAIFDHSQPAWWPGYRIAVHIPFSGDEGVFRLRANQFSLSPPTADVRPGELVDVIEYPHDAPVDIKARAEALAQKVGQHLAWSQADIQQYNTGLDHTAHSSITTRRERMRRNYEHLQAAGLPMSPPDESPKTYITDTVVRRPAPLLPATPENRPMVLEPVLADDIYEHILGVIRSVGRDMERSPKAYVAMGEEDRRQALLLALNTHYRGQTTAEAFNMSGKTDLLVRHEGQNLFIGECKFWSGPKGFLATVDQLFGYRAWRDTKLAIVMFVRELDLTAIVERARDALETHAQFIEWKKSATDTELRCGVSWPGDDRRHGDLNVFFVHVPTS